MPFQIQSPSGQGATPAAAPVTGGTVTMKVDPENVLALKKELETARNTVRDYLNTEGDNLRVAPLAADQVSNDASQDFTSNANTALEVARAFVGQLSATIDSLDRTAKTYGLAEDNNTAMMKNRSS